MDVDLAPRIYFAASLDRAAYISWHRQVCLTAPSIAEAQNYYTRATPLLRVCRQALIDAQWRVADVAQGPDILFALHPPDDHPAANHLFRLPQELSAFFADAATYQTMFDTHFNPVSEDTTRLFYPPPPFRDLLALLQLILPGCFCFIRAEYTSTYHTSVQRGLQEDSDDSDDDVTLVTTSRALPSRQWFDNNQSLLQSAEIFGDRLVALRNRQRDFPDRVSYLTL